MCSSIQPKMFPNAMPLGTGGTSKPPVVYPSGTQPTFDAGNAGNFPAATKAPIPTPPVSTVPKVPVTGGGVTAGKYWGSNPIRARGALFANSY